MAISSLIFNQLVLLIVIFLNFGIFLLLIKKYLNRKKKVALYLSLVDLFIIVPALYVFMQITFSTSILISNIHFSGIAIFFIGMTNVFLTLAVYEIFQKPSKKIQTIIKTILISIGLILLALSIHGIISDPSERNPIFFGFMALYLLFSNIISIYLYSFIFINSYKLKKHIDDSMGKRGFNYLVIFSATAMLFMMLNMLITFPVPNETYLFGLVWIIAVVSSIFAYLGFIFPFKSSEV